MRSTAGTPTQILLHYYPGTELGTHPGTLARVLLVDGAASAALGSAAPWRVVDAAGTKLKLPAGDLTLPASLKLQGKPLVSPLTFRPGKARVEVDGRPYRGSLTVISDGTKLQVVNVVQLESYLEGVVGEEVSPTWPEAALEAQAIAARSYALSQLARADAASPFDLYADGRSQVYGGIDAESPAITDAVTATARRVVLYDGAVATTYFSSSSGGLTAASDDTIGFAGAVSGLGARSLGHVLALPRLGPDRHEHASGREGARPARAAGRPRARVRTRRARDLRHRDNRGEDRDADGRAAARRARPSLELVPARVGR